MPLSQREMALVSYFYTIATDPRVVAAGYSPAKFGAAVLDCVKEDLVNVTGFVLGTGVKPKVKEATKRVAKTVLGGVVSEETSEALQAELGDKIETGFRLVGDWLQKEFKKK